MALVVAIVAACSSGPTPPASSRELDLASVSDALRREGIAIVDVAENLNPRDGAWQCLPGSFRLARVSQQPTASVAHPGDRPSVEILMFATEAARAAAQATIDADGQVHAQGCAAMVDWVAPPHVVGVRNVILFTATDDAAVVADLQAAASGLTTAQ